MCGTSPCQLTRRNGRAKELAVGRKAYSSAIESFRQKLTDYWGKYNFSLFCIKTYIRTLFQITETLSARCERLGEENK